MRIEPARYFSIYCLSIWAPADYTNFLDHAREILKGQWFGSYSDLTLVKSPFFAIFIAAAAKEDLQDKSVYFFFSNLTYSQFEPLTLTKVEFPRVPSVALCSEYRSLHLSPRFILEIIFDLDR